MSDTGGTAIVVKSVDGETFRLGICENESVANIKMKIYMESGISPKLIKLLFEGRTLENDEYINNENIPNESIINMIILLKCAMEICVKSRHGSTVEMEVFQNEKVKSIKVKIYERKGISVKIITLQLQGDVLNNGERIKDTNICDKSVIDMIVQPVAIRKIYGQLLDREAFAFEVREDEKVEKIKMKISKRTGIPPEEMRSLICKDEFLDCHELIKNTNISDNSVIHVVSLKDDMSICIKPENGKAFMIAVSWAATVFDVKKEIEKKRDFAPDQMRLMYKGEPLQRDRRINSYQITDKSVITLLRDDMQIYMKTLDGKTFAIAVSWETTIFDIKMEISKMMDLAPDEMKLVFQGGILEDDKTVVDYKIMDKSVINIVTRLRGAMQIIARTMDGKAVAFEVSKTTTVRYIKKKIQEKIGLAPEQMKLVFQGEILEDDKTADDYGIMDKSVINVVARLRGDMQIYMKTLDGKTFAIAVSLETMILDIKMEISKMMDLAPDEMKLVFQGDVLDKDHLTAGHYRIKENSEINVVPILRDGMLIFAKTMDGKAVAFEVSKTTTVRDIKKKIQEKIGLAPDEMKLVFQGLILEDDKTAGHYGIMDKSIINVVARLRGGMLIFAKTMDEKTVAFEVSNTTTVRDIKKLFQEKIGLAPDEMTLVFQGGILEDDKTVDDYGIRDKSVINVFARLRGVSVKSLAGSIFPFEIAGNETVEYFKRKLSEESGISVQSIKLLFRGEILSNDELIGSRKIPDNSVINMVTLQCDQISITIELPENKTREFQVYKQDTVRDLKGQIVQSTKIEMQNQKLMFGLDILEDNRTLGDYEIQDGNALTLIVDSIGN